MHEGMAAGKGLATRKGLTAHSPTPASRPVYKAVSPEQLRGDTTAATASVTEAPVPGQHSLSSHWCTPELTSDARHPLLRGRSSVASRVSPDSLLCARAAPLHVRRVQGTSEARVRRAWSVPGLLLLRCGPTQTEVDTVRLATSEGVGILTSLQTRVYTSNLPPPA